jgi:hypothetical protein
MTGFPFARELRQKAAIYRGWQKLATGNDLLLDGRRPPGVLGSARSSEVAEIACTDVRKRHISEVP